MCYLPLGTCPYQNPHTGVCNGRPPLDCYWKLQTDLDSDESFDSESEDYHIDCEHCSQSIEEEA